MLNDLTGPSQLTDPLEKWGVMVIVATTGDRPVLVAVKTGILPVPDAAKPMLVRLFDHE